MTAKDAVKATQHLVHRVQSEAQAEALVALKTAMDEREYRQEMILSLCEAVDEALGQKCFVAVDAAIVEGETGVWTFQVKFVKGRRV